MEIHEEPTLTLERSSKQAFLFSDYSSTHTSILRTLRVMTKDITKKKVRTSTDDELIEECRKETLREDCESIDWMQPSKGEEITPPSNTLAVVVDMIHNRGAVRIFEQGSDEYVDGVGLEDAGSFVIIAWNPSWWLRPSGSIRIGYARGKPAV